MKTRRSLKPDQPLLVGRLVRTTGYRGRPELGLDVWCPFCKRDHNHGWEDPPFRLDEVSHRVAHCDASSPLYQAGYWVGLDPAAGAHNRKLKAEVAKARIDWESRRPAPGPPANEPVRSPG